MQFRVSMKAKPIKTFSSLLFPLYFLSHLMFSGLIHPLHTLDALANLWNTFNNNFSPPCICIFPSFLVGFFAWNLVLRTTQACYQKSIVWPCQNWVYLISLVARWRLISLNVCILKSWRAVQGSRKENGGVRYSGSFKRTEKYLTHHWISSTRRYLKCCKSCLLYMCKERRKEVTGSYWLKLDEIIVQDTFLKILRV